MMQFLVKLLKGVFDIGPLCGCTAMRWHWVLWMAEAEKEAGRGEREQQGPGEPTDRTVGVSTPRTWDTVWPWHWGSWGAG